SPVMSAFITRGAAVEWFSCALLATSLGILAMAAVANVACRIWRRADHRAAIWTATLVLVVLSPLIWCVLAPRPVRRVTVSGARPWPAPPRENAALAVPPPAGVPTAPPADASASTPRPVAAQPTRTMLSRDQLIDAGRLAALALYACGLAFALLSLLVRHRRTGELIASSTVVCDQRLRQRVRSWCEQLGVSRLPEIRGSRANHVPALAGLTRPVILLPAALLEDDVHRHVLDSAVAHELVHLRRHDHWTL